jgi:HSP20 family protein
MANENWLPSLFGAHGFEPEGFRSTRRDLERMFDELSGSFMRGTAGTVGMPLRIDVSETDTEIRVTAELPGVDQKDIDVTLSGDRLTIRGEKKSESEKDEGSEGRKYHRVERAYGMFERSMTLPFAAEADAVTASFKDGVLAVTVAKPKEVKAGTRKVEITSG